MKIKDFRRDFVYHAPQYPGYTCWTGLYLMPDESVMCCFTQAMGPFRGRPQAPEAVRKALDWPPPGHQGEFGATGEIYDMTGLDLQNVHLRSHDFAKTWDYVGGDHFKTCMNGITGECEVAPADGSILRGVWGPYLPYDDVPRNGYIQRSTDGGKSWGPPEVIYSREGFMFWPKRIRTLGDGRLLTGGGLITIHPEHNHRRGWFRDITLALFVSDDQGYSWSGPIDLIPPGQDKKQLGLAEEFDWVELPGGDLLVVMRADNYPGGAARLQTRMAAGDGTWQATRIEKAPFPHSGHPELLITREGVVFHIATTALSWTINEGRTWQDVDLGREPFSPDSARDNAVGYYPRSVQMANGEVVIVGHVGSDNGYGQVDQSIIAARFRVEL